MLPARHDDDDDDKYMKLFRKDKDQESNRIVEIGRKK